MSYSGSQGAAESGGARALGRAVELRARLRFRPSLFVSRLSLAESWRNEDEKDSSSSYSSSSRTAALVAEVANESPFPLRAWVGLRTRRSGEGQQRGQQEPPSAPPPSSSAVVVAAAAGDGKNGGGSAVSLPAFPLELEALLPPAASSSLEALRARPAACLSSSLALFWQLDDGEEAKEEEEDDEEGGGRPARRRRGVLPLPTRLLSAAISGKRGRRALDALAPAAIHVKVEPIPEGSESRSGDGNGGGGDAAAAAPALLRRSSSGKLSGVRALVGVPLPLSLAAERRLEGGESGDVEVEVGLLRTRALPPPLLPAGGDNKNGDRQRRRSTSVVLSSAAASDDDDESEKTAAPGGESSVVATGVVEGARLSLPGKKEEEGETSAATKMATTTKTRRGFTLTFLTKGTFAVEPRGVVARRRRRRGEKSDDGEKYAVLDSSSEALYVFVE